MITKRIRQLAVETVVNTDEPTTKLITMIYTVGRDREIPLNGKPEKRTICEIVATEKHYKLYISDGTTSQVWKEIPKSKRVASIDYFID